MVGDVSGKGVPASLFMAKVTSEFRFLAASGMGPARVLAGLNAKLVQDASGNLFVTVFYLIFDMRTHRVTYSTGGHLPAIRVEQDAAGPEFLNVEEGMPLALMEGEFAERSVPIRPGDVFVLYTDGVTEAVGARRQQYGEERLCALVKANRALSAEQIKEAIWRDVKRFERSAAQHDDITILVIKAG